MKIVMLIVALSEALEFQKRERKWPDISVINDVIKDGCLLIHQPSNGETYNLEWKITFSVAEQRLAKVSRFWDFRKRRVQVRINNISYENYFYVDVRIFRSESMVGVSCEFEPRSWRGVLDTLLCDKKSLKMPKG
jgi:hypothetical protein